MPPDSTTSVWPSCANPASTKPSRVSSVRWRFIPGDAQTHNDLAVALAQKRRFKEAVAHFREAIADRSRIRPGPIQPGMAAGHQPGSGSPQRRRGSETGGEGGRSLTRKRPLDSRCAGRRVRRSRPLSRGRRNRAASSGPGAQAPGPGAESADCDVRTAGAVPGEMTTSSRALPGCEWRPRAVRRPARVQPTGRPAPAGSAPAVR